MTAGKTTKSYDDTTAAAREIIDAEKKKHDAKTARLKEARLAKEAPADSPKRKAKSGGRKAKGKR